MRPKGRDPLRDPDLKRRINTIVNAAAQRQGAAVRATVTGQLRELAARGWSAEDLHSHLHLVERKFFPAPAVAPLDDGSDLT